ncbi:hypothetical protein [Caudoviricetes sp.]|nr:hypothetical protein [Caudoviricetes sp.]
MLAGTARKHRVLAATPRWRVYRAPFAPPSAGFFMRAPVRTYE